MPSSAPLKPAEMRAWRAFLDAQANLLGLLEAELVKEEQLTLPEYEVLDQLAQATGHRLRMSDLSRKVGLSRSGSTRLVDRLVRTGLVGRTACPSDRRGMFATLTPAGSERLRRAGPTHLRGVRDHFARHLTAQQLRLLTATLEPLGAGMRRVSKTP